MLGYSDNKRFYLFSNELGEQRIPPYKNYHLGSQETIERNKDGKYFETKINNALELYREGYEYLLKANVLYGINIEVKLLIKEKDELTIEQNWKTRFVTIDMTELDFDDEQLTVKAGVKTGGLMNLIENRWNEEYDIMPNIDSYGNPLSSLKRVDVRLDPRGIYRESKLFVEDGTEVTAVVSGDSLNARAIPFQVEYNSDQDNINAVLGQNLNANNGDYATVSFENVGNIFYLNADRDRRIRLTGKVKTVQSGTPHPGTFYLDLVRYNNGEDLNFDEVIERLDSCNPIITGDICEYDFDDYEIIVKEGESIAITTLSDTFDGIKYQVFNTEIYIREDDLFPITYTKAIRPMDLGERLVSIITGNEDSFDSSIFKEGGKYENYLLAHGTWLRNMPEVLNQGQDSEKRVQASISLETMYEAYGINEPLRYDTNQVGLGEVFEIGTEKETQQNFVSIRIGETRDKFRLNQVKPIRKVIGDNYYSSIHIGSTKSGNDYGEVNNLYSICGNANFTTINALNDSEYKATTEVRTGAEDVEFTRSVQYEDFPDKDTERDDDWFLLHCTKVGDEYFLVKWPALYSEKPNNVYSASTNYNYAFSPARLLLGHGWKLNSGLMPNIKDKISFSKSNCNGSLVTKKAGEEELYEDGGKSIEQDKRIEHKWLENPTVISKTVEFSHPVTQEIWDMLNGTTNGVDNKYGLVEYLTRDGVQYGRLIKVDRSGEGKWTLIEAKLN